MTKPVRVTFTDNGGVERTYGAMLTAASLSKVLCVLADEGTTVPPALVAAVTVDIANVVPCEACGADAGEPCDPFCVGAAQFADDGGVCFTSAG